MTELSTQQAWETRYQEGSTPWDTRITPPEVVRFWATPRIAPAGWALDLGCGTATNVGYLAERGLSVLGCDLAGNALALGMERLRAERPAYLGQISLVQADVTRLPFAPIAAQYVLDIGCFHGLPNELRGSYVRGVIEHLAPGGYYHLFAFDWHPDNPARGVDENEIAERFAPHLTVVEIERGRPDRQPCRWYLLQKQSG